VRSGREYATARTTAISDGVFAVALTLLILDVKIPDGDVRELGHALHATLYPMLICVLSFAIVAYYWVVHHLIFDSMRAVKLPLVWVNLAFLLTVVVLPFSTAVLGRYPLAPDALMIYGLNLTACTTVLAATWYVAQRSGLTEALEADQKRYILWRFASQPAASLVGVALASVVPAVSLVIFALTPIFYALTYRRSYY
jgi:uncharacterized membrane protein